MGRNFLAHREGDAINAVLAACRLQLLALDPMAQAFVAHNLAGPGRGPGAAARLKNENFTFNSIKGGGT